MNPTDNQTNKLAKEIDPKAVKVLNDFADNQTPQPVDELDEILSGLVDWAESGRSKFGRPDGVYTIREAKARLLQWGTRQKIEQVYAMVSDPEYLNGKLVSGYIDIDSYEIQDIIAELQASLKDGEER